MTDRSPTEWSANWSGTIQITPAMAEALAARYTYLCQQGLQSDAFLMAQTLGLLGLGFEPLATEDEGWFLSRRDRPPA